MSYLFKVALKIGFTEGRGEERSPRYLYTAFIKSAPSSSKYENAADAKVEH